MAITIKRDIPEFDDKLFKERSKYYNLVNFSGLNHNHNLFEVDQSSFLQSNNVYLNRNKTLISRPAIIKEDLPKGYLQENNTTTLIDILDEEYKLTDIKEIGKISIYVGKNELGLYQITAYNTSTQLVHFAPTKYTKYHISTIDNYIIIFNDVDALVLDINDFDDGWKLLRNMTEIPITKRIIGQNIFEYPKDQFTESYKEEYVWSEDTLNILPEGTAKAIIGQTPKNLEWHLEQADLNTEHRLLRSLNVKMKSDDIVSTKINEDTGILVVSIARYDHVLISLNGGISFERVLYPQNEGYKNIAGLSENGLYFYFVATNGVYRYQVGELNTLRKWHGPIKVKNEESIEGTTINNYSHWVDDESFAFVTFREEADTIVRTRLYFKHFNRSHIDYIDLDNNVHDPNTQANMTGKDLAPNMISIYNEVNINKMHIVAWLPSMTSNAIHLLWATAQSINPSEFEVLIKERPSDPVNRPFSTIFNLETISSYQDYSTNFEGIEFECFTVDNDRRWWQVKITLGYYSGFRIYDIEWLYDLELSLDTSSGGPIHLQNAYIINKTISSVDGVVDLPTKTNDPIWLNSTERQLTVSTGKYYFIVLDDIMYTNVISEDNNVSIIYDYIINEPYTKVPDISHSTTNLYLVFDNNLKITANIKDGQNYNFSLPIINNHSFLSKITGVINVSTTEVAIFLKDRVYINMLVPDEMLVARYDYLNTRLSVGIRLNDDIINTNDGMFTIYPTNQGLAALNYQPDVANTDQIVDYLTEKITETWHNFYNVNNPIKIVQNEHQIWLSNNTDIYLLLDLRNMSWWKLTSPIPVFKILAETNKFNIISDGLYKYDTTSNTYYDLHNDYTEEPLHIEWEVSSQLLHLDAINYFKNIKQIVYQLEESNIYKQSMISTIQLYRKIITDKEPETIAFDIEGYRTFVKRFNYWKVNLLQWSLKYDHRTESPTQLKLNGLAIKYEISEEVR